MVDAQTNENYPDDVIKALAHHYREILQLLGEDVSREGLLKTPERAARAMYYCTRGYRQDADKVINGAVFEANNHEMVVVRNIEFYSLCEHHLLPFFGHVSVGYIPGKTIVGLSKIARIVDMFARRLQVQERFCDELCAVLYEKLGAQGVMIECRASHLCMKMRGVAKQDSITVTTASRGIFEVDSSLRSQFFSALN
ncbi:MAG: GTP cyclohydrolase I FolE [Paramuribaculum sp.]|nr:GTP cyclohydrolase I FolE [Paramuribaculum sp.]